MIEINSHKDLKRAKQILKAKIDLGERDIINRWYQLPEQCFNSATSFIIPAFIHTRIAGKTWVVLKDIMAILSPFNAEKRTYWKDIVQQIGIADIIKKGIGFFKKKE